MVSVNKLVCNFHILCNQPIHLLFYILFFLPRRFMVEDITDFAFLTLDMSIPTPFTTKHTDHQLIKKMFCSMCRWKLFLIVLIEQISLIFHLYVEFVNSSRISIQCHWERSIFLQFYHFTFTSQQIGGCHFLLWHLKKFESMTRNLNLNLNLPIQEIDDYQQHFIILFTKKGELVIGIEINRCWINIHQIKTFTLSGCTFMKSDIQDVMISHIQL